ncbi:protein apterous-like [Schistocerca serialis cubense]|uniref:protein apterous-like n=1 Tax=Schistocerca serialis cubense TaxID=2023355 RepID=UPI00214F3581|nr:protein apterous-like [Schistocerca serialis cubense]
MGDAEPPPATPQADAVVCAGCGRRICDRYYLLAVDRRWHANCLICYACRRPLDGEGTCFAKDGSIYCKKDYHRLFGVRRCARCHAAILPTELVLRARDLVFHVHCFKCAACDALLTKGDHYGMRDAAVFCRLHYELRCEAPPAPAPAPGPLPPPFPSPEFLPHAHPHPHPHHHPPAAAPPPVHDPSKLGFFNGGGGGGATTARQKGRPRKRKTKELEHMTASLDLNADYLDTPFGRGPGTPGVVNGQQRTKRMRTSFKHHQLRTMKSYFAINHNPDAKDLKQLSQKTGLPKRVLQVWFQNARAKWRRMVLKQEGKGGGGDKCGGGDSGLDAYQAAAAAAAAADYHRQGPISPPFMLGTSPSPLECS